MRPSSEIGDLAEVLTNYHLAAAGLVAFAPSMSHLPYDLLVDTSYGNFLRIQVKGSRNPRVLRGKVTNSYVFNIVVNERNGRGKRQYQPSDLDWFAFVALDLEKVLFVPSHEVLSKKISQFSVTTARFANESVDSLAAVVDDARRCVENSDLVRLCNQTAP